MPEAPQAFVEFVKRGGARTLKRICDQFGYLSRRGHIPLYHASRAGFDLPIPYDQFKTLARSWAQQTGIYQPGQRDEDSHREMTTHIVVSFPPGTNQEAAHKAGKAWAREVFQPVRVDGEPRRSTFDFVWAFHVDRPHPHLHVIVNRRSFEGDWLKISKDNDDFNYDRMRDMLVTVAHRYGIDLLASSRAERGIFDRPLTKAEYRRRTRENIVMRSHRGDLEYDDPAETPEPPENAAGPSGQRLRSVGQPNTPASGGSSGGSTPAIQFTASVDQERHFEAAQQRRDRVAEQLDANEATEPAPSRLPRSAGQPNAPASGGSSGGSAPAIQFTASIDQERHFEAAQQRRNQAAAQREENEATEPNGRRLPLSAEAQQERADLAAQARAEREAIEQESDLPHRLPQPGSIDDAASRQSPVQPGTADPQRREGVEQGGSTDDVQIGDPDNVAMGDADEARRGRRRRRQPQGPHPMTTRAAEREEKRRQREERRARRRGDDLEWSMETRAMERVRLEAEAALANAPTHPMQLRDTRSRQERRARDQEGNQGDENVRPPNERTPHGRRGRRTIR